MADQTPVDVEAIRARLDAATFTADIIFDNRGGDGEFFKHAPTDLRRLLDENARLNAELAARRNLGVEYERLRVENIQLRDQLAAVRKIKPQRRNSAMVTSEQLATMRGWNDAVDEIRAALNPCECGMTDPSTWETYGGATEPGSVYEWNPDCPAHGAEPTLDAAPEMPRPPAEEAREPRGDATGSTGVPEPEKGAQASKKETPGAWIARKSPDATGDDYYRELAAFDADKSEYCRAVDTEGCSCVPRPNFPILADLNRWCREHGLLALVPAELTQSVFGIRGGEPCILNTRVPVEEVAGYLADGATWDEVREMLPSLPSLPVPSTETRPDYQNEPEGAWPMANRCKHERSCTACGKCANVCRCDPIDLYAAEDLEEMSTGVDPLEPFQVETPKESR